MKPTQKQIKARTTNFAKARIKASYSACIWAIDNAQVSGECKEFLSNALNSLDEAIRAWDNNNKRIMDLTPNDKE